jgi:signal transduction histidine kinase
LIQPVFYKTGSFIALCTGIVVVSLGMLWRVRSGVMRRRLVIVLAERTRVARELHDTLLQGLVGIAFQFDAISQQLSSSPDLARQRLSEVRDHVQHYIKETRFAIWALRSPIFAGMQLPDVLQRMAAGLVAGKELRVRHEMSGVPRRVSSELQHQVLRIAQELLTNVVRHARATTVTMRLDYEADAIRLEILDDGGGFIDGNATENEWEGWGLRAVRERAQEINASLTIMTGIGGGTKVTLRVPTA